MKNDFEDFFVMLYNFLHDQFHHHKNMTVVSLYIHLRTVSDVLFHILKEKDVAVSGIVSVQQSHTFASMFVFLAKSAALLSC